MNKKIIILAVTAVVIIAAAVSAVFFLRDGNKAQDETTTLAPESNSYEYPSYEYPEFTTAPTDLTTEDASANAEESSKNDTSSTSKIQKVTTTIKKTTTTKKNNKVTTTKKQTSSDIDIQKLLSEKQALGFRYMPGTQPTGDFYYTDDKDCWQVNCGYNEVYDHFAPMTAMFIDQVRIRFDYEGQEWMIQLWKGNYGWLFVGAEIGVYTAPIGTYQEGSGAINHYNCADKSDWLSMQLDCYFAEKNNGHYKKVFTREYGKYWWATGFVKGQLTKYTAPRTELKIKGRITFKSERMADLFIEGLRGGGFRIASGNASNQLADDTFYQSGADVWFNWATVNEDAFIDIRGIN